MKQTKPLRILHLLNHVSMRGNGIVNVAVDLALEQARAGHQVAVASAGGEYEPLLQQGGVQCLYAPQAGAKSFLPNLLRLFRVVRQFRPDILHAHMRSGLLLAWPLARLTRKPFIMHLHNIHDRHYNLIRLPDRVVAVSGSVGETLVQQGLPRKRMRVVMNGVLHSPRRPADPPEKQLEQPAIVTVAGMVHRKGIAELIDAFSLIADKHPKAHLYLVGTGLDEKEFQARAAEQPASARIHFENFQSEPRSYLRAAEVFVLASRRDSCGLVLIEARGEGCAIIGTDVDGVPEQLDYGEAGLLTPVGDPPALAERMDRLLIDDALRTRLQQRAKQNLERYTTEAMSQSMMHVYEELMHSRKEQAATADKEEYAMQKSAPGQGVFAHAADGQVQESSR